MSEPEPQSVSQLEVEEFLQTQVVRRRLLPRAVLVGLASGALAVAFRVALQLLEDLRLEFVKVSSTSPFVSFVLIASLGALGTWIALSLGRLDRDAGGSGIPQMKAVLEGHLKMNWARIVWVKFLGALAALGSGLALGREGPTIQMGGAIGEGVSKLTHSTVRERKALTAAGSGAGLAAAFNAPLAGVTFVLEELQRDFQPVVFVAALLCAAVASVMSRLVSGQFPVFTVPAITPPPMTALPLFAVIGVLGGLLGVAFNKALLKSLKVFDKWRAKVPYYLALFIGLLLASAATLSPAVLGGGHGLSEQAIYGQLTLLLAIEVFLVRFVLIHYCYATGVPGGIFAPLLSLGALLGLITFQVTGLMGMQGGVTVAVCAVAGMCAMFSGIVRAPLTGVVLIGEMTGSFELMLPLLVTSFAAYTVAESLKDVPIYEALLQRIAVSRGFDFDEEERQFVEYEVRPGSALAGKTLRDAGLPPGVLVVLCSIGGTEFVPNGDTVLEEHTKISVLANSGEVMHLIATLARS